MLGYSVGFRRLSVFNLRFSEVAAHYYLPSFIVDRVAVLVKQGPDNTAAAGWLARVVIILVVANSYIAGLKQGIDCPINSVWVAVVMRRNSFITQRYKWLASLLGDRQQGAI